MGKENGPDVSSWAVCRHDLDGIGGRLRGVPGARPVKSGKSPARGEKLGRPSAECQVQTACSTLGTKSIDLALDVWLHLAEIVEELLGRFGRDLLPGLQSRSRHRQRRRAEMREFATLRLLRGLGRVGERRLGDAVRGDANEKGRLRRPAQRVGEREKTHRELKIVTRLSPVRRLEQR